MFDLTTVKVKAYLSLQSASNMSPLPNHYDGELLPIFPSLHLRLLPSCSRMDTLTSISYRTSPHSCHRRHRPPTPRRLLPSRLPHNPYSLGHPLIPHLHPQTQLRPHRLPLPPWNLPLACTARSAKPCQHRRPPLPRRTLHHRLQRCRLPAGRDQAARLRGAGPDYRPDEGREAFYVF